MVNPEHDLLLAEATNQLVEEYRDRVVAGRVIGAVTRTRDRLRSGYDALMIDAPPPEEYAALIVGLARQKLDDLNKRIYRQRHAFGVG
jgi:hypothetical protein